MDKHFVTSQYIVYLKRVERRKYKDMIYHHSYIQTLSNCKIKARKKNIQA